MHPDEAVRQIQCVVNASLDQSGGRTAPMYRPTFRRVAAAGTGADVSTLAEKLCTDIQRGTCPAPEAAEGYAAQILRSRQAMTDGGTR